MIDLGVIKKECDCLVLFSGDADFIPALNLIKSNGKRVFVSSVYEGFSYDLRKKFPFFILDTKSIINNCLKDNSV